MQNHPFAKTIWDKLKADIKNEIGVAAMMGNLRAESGLYPYRLQGDFSSGYTTSIDYTTKVNSGIISENDFVYNGPNGGGYGLAQWTFWSRKKKLYDRWKNNAMYDSIGSVDLACDFLLWELKNSYSGVYKALVNATSIRTASDIVLHNFENPADQSESVEILRTQLGTEVYNAFSGSEPIEPDTPDTPDTPSKKKNSMSLLMMYSAIKR